MELDALQTDLVYFTSAQYILFPTNINLERNVYYFETNVSFLNHQILENHPANQFEKHWSLLTDTVAFADLHYFT
jgi:hypothetical protein